MHPSDFTRLPDDNADYPLSSAQQAVWLDQLLRPDSPCYNIGMALRIDGDLDPALLRRAIELVVDGNDALRLTLDDAQPPRQRVQATRVVTLPCTDLSSSSQAEAEAQAAMQSAFQQPFGLQGPLWDTRLFRTGPRSHYWLHRYHHLVTDGAGVALIGHAVERAYNALLLGREPDTAGPSYLEFIAEDQAYLASPRYARDRRFWLERHASLPPALLDSAPARDGQAPSGHLRWSIERGVYEKLHAAAVAEGSSIAHALLAALAIYFCRTTQADEIVIGMSVHNRTGARQKQTLGMFSTVLPLRIGVDRGASLPTLLHHIGTQLRECYRHQRFPIAELNRSLELARHGRRQLFDVRLSFESLAGDARFGDAPVEAIALDNGHEQTPLAVFVRDYHADRDVVIDFNYRPDAFDAPAMATLQQRFAHLVAAMADDMHRTVADLPLMTAAERATVLHAFNDTTTAMEDAACVHQLFEWQAERTPDAPALQADGVTLSYARLNERANQLAHFLKHRGLGPDQLVGLYFERGQHMVVALLAVLKAGAAYVPLDPSHPPARLAEIAADAGLALILAHSGMLPPFPDVPVVATDADEAQWRHLPRFNPAPTAGSRHLAYVIYTSGSTGRPKGAMNEHGAVVNRIAWMQRAYALTPADRVIQKTPYGFDVSVWEFLWPLAYGATLVMARPDGHKDAAYLAAFMAGERISVAHFVPSMLALFLREPAARHATALRHVVCSGEALPRDLLRTALRTLPHAALHNLYGPTECAVDVTAWTAHADAKHVSIGAPIANTRIYVLDEHDMPVPIGVPGQLHIGGVQVGRGYLNRPALTAQAFVADPYAGAPDARMYRSGDRARWLPDGTLEYLGRMDFQLKLRGQRLEAGEIEQQLMRDGQLAACVVTIREHHAGDQRLVAYCVPAADAAPDPAALAEALRARLPEYMVPSAFVMLAALPLSPNGKLDRRALPAPDWRAVHAYEAPRNDDEALLARVWAEVLGVETVGRHDNFFGLGGHSLLAVALTERLRALGWKTQVADLYGAPTVAGLAAAAGPAAHARLAAPGRRAATPAPTAKLTADEMECIHAAVPGGAANVQDIYPLVAMQEGILFHHRMQETRDDYLMSHLSRFDDKATLDRYLLAAQAVIDRHDILRTAVVWEGLREPRQVVWRNAVLPIETVELQAGRDAAAQMRARFMDSPQRLPLDRAPLVRAHMARDPADGSWLLVLVNHHIIDDNTTLRLVFAEIEAHLAGQAATLAPPLPFRPHAELARERAGDAGHEPFFRAMLADVTEATAPFGLGGDLAGAPVAEAALALPSGLASRLRQQARRQGVPVASLIHTAWALALARMAGRDDVVFGTVLSGRMHAAAGAGTALGVFINTLPVRIALGGDSAATLLARMHTALTSLLAHEHAPLSLAQRMSGIPAPAPLFAALFNYRHGGQVLRRHAGQNAALAGITPIEARERASYPLTMSVDDDADGFELAVQIDARIDPARVCAIMATALETLEHALAHDDGAAAALDVLPAAERAWLDDLRHGACAPMECMPAHTQFERQAARTPHAVALASDAASLSYAELNRAADDVAARLQAHGIRNGDVVAVCLDRGIRAIAALLGVWKAGAVYLPVAPTLPPRRAETMLADARVALVLTETSCRSPLPSGYPAHLLDEPAPPGASCAAPAQTQPSDLAYVLYTSGSTGRPKGVAMPHRALCNLVEWQRQHEKALGKLRTLQFAPAGFDVALQEICTTLCNGAALVLCDEETRRDMSALTLLLDRQKVERLFLPFVALHQLAEVATTDGAAPRHLKAVITAGEQLRVTPALRALFAAMPGCRLDNQYGPTETHVATSHVLPPDSAEWPLLPTIGRPVANTDVHILDLAGNPAPVQVTGEICVGGAQVAQGYLNDPARTAERFVVSRCGSRLYRTGDLGRWTPDGEIEFLGRRDSQVKVRGFRIEPGEIEHVLATHPDVREAAVVLREDHPGRPRLVAYVVPRGEPGPAPDALSAWLKAALPEYMVPSAVMLLAALPLSSNGKLAPAALPVPPEPGCESPAAPTSTVQAIVLEIAAAVLGRERVGARDDFFRLGGHSLLATRLVADLRRGLGVDIPLRDVFAMPVLGDLAAWLERQAGDGAQPAIPLAPRTGPLPASFAQERMWFLAEMDGAQPLLPLAVRLRGPLDRDRLRQALQGIVDRHETLRTTLAYESGQVVQAICPDWQVDLPEIDLSPLPPDDRWQAVRMHRERDAAAGFAPQARSWFRATLLKLGGDAHVLLLLTQGIADGWSIGIFTRELDALYTHGAASLPPLALQYADHAAWQRGPAHAAVVARQTAYWREQLAGLPPLLELPLDRVRPPVRGNAGARCELAVPPDLAAALRALSYEHGATLFMTLAAVFAALLGRHANQDDIAIGTPIANRTRHETGGLIGAFVNTLVLRARLDRAASFADLLRQMKQTCLEAYAHQDAPFEHLVTALNPERSLAHTPLFQAMLVLQNNEEVGFNLPGVDCVALADDTVHARFDLMLTLRETGSGLAGTLDYSTELFDAATMQRMSGHFLALLQAAATGPGTPLAALPMLTAVERHQTTMAFNATRRGNADTACMHTLFERQFRIRPQAPAVIAGPVSLTYGELESRSNRLAHHLRRLGVGPEVLVGVCAERGVDLVVALLAVLKAGGAYVPLDPNYPAQRLALMVQDAAPAVLLSQESLLARLPASAASVLCLDRDAASWADMPDHAPRGHAGADSLAYVIYTSGSTGTPKGVMITHGAAVNTLLDINHRFDVTAQDKVLALSSVSFDLSVYDLFGLFAAGGCVVLPDPGEADPLHWQALLRKHGVTIWNSAPPLMQLHTDSADPSGAGSVRLVMLSGDKTPVSLARHVHARFPQARLYSLGGATEVSIWSVCCPVGKPLAQGGTIAYGAPMANQTVYVLNSTGQPCPIGVAGELHIGGAGVARGYLRRPELNAERFLPDPFEPGSGGRLYRTGDLVRWRADGMLEFLGRTDHQVKLRGFRIELGEIEARLAGCSGVEEAAVLVREDRPGDRRLVAYVVPRGASDVQVEQVRAELAAVLPEHMLPAAWMVLDRLPLSSNGKIDRKALPRPDYGGDESARILPRTETERRLAAIWCEMLGLETIGVGDDFFMLGGHSLLAARLIAKVNSTFGAALPLARLFTARTIETMAACLEDGGEAPAGQLVVPLRRGGNAAPVFLIHPAGGGIFAYAALARKLDAGRAVFGVQSAHLAGVDIAPYDGGAVSAAYAASIQAAHPDGPLCLAGWSLGGVLAVQVAHLLERAGRTVEWVALFDSYSEPRRTPFTLSYFCDWLLALDAADLDLIYGADIAALHTQARQQAATMGIEAFVAALERADGTVAPHYRAALLQTFEAMRRDLPLLEGLREVTVDAPLHVFWAERTLAEGQDPRAWAARSTRAGSVHVLLGVHQTFVIGENADRLAGVLNACGAERHALDGQAHAPA